MDLERVRDVVFERLRDKDIDDRFDAHLKEDAEREQEYALLDATIRRVEAENAKLREDLHQVKRQRDEADDELANLREENARLRARRADAEVFRAWAEDYKSQRDNLLAALRDISRHHPVDDYVQQEADAAIAEVEGES